MQRINLVDRRSAAPRASLSPWLAGVGGGSVVLLLASLFVVHANSRAEAALRVAENVRQQAAIEAITARVTDHPAVRAELRDLRQREEVVTGLQGRRVDASARLLEISRILTRGMGPTLRPGPARDYQFARVIHDQPWTAQWDPHRLWLTAMEEEGDRLFIRGEGLSVADVGELLKRLQSSAYFNDVRLEHTELATTDRNAPATQRFTLVARL